MGGSSFERSFEGQEAVTIEDFSREAAQTMDTNQRVDWRATLRVREHWASKGKTRFVLGVEDARMAHLSEIHLSDQCTFARSWKAFNEHHRGVNHRALSYCRFFIIIFLFVGAGTVYLVHQELTTPRLRALLGKHSFHWIVLAKFVAQDIPQQICIVLYLFGWYEASGLRCQLCLFEAAYCGHEEPFHFTNLVAITCTLLSSCANQLLIRPITKKKYTEDDVCMQYCVRIGGVSVSVLPFTTTFFFASRSLLPITPTLVHIVLGIPCALGWLCLSGLFCMPFMICCDDDRVMDICCAPCMMCCDDDCI